MLYWLEPEADEFATPSTTGTGVPLISSRLRIKGHGHQSCPLRINQMPGSCVAGLRPAGQIESLARCDRWTATCDGRSAIPGSKKHGLAAGQELRPELGSFPFSESDQRLRGASRVRQLLEGKACSGGEGDCPLAAPTASERIPGIAEGYGRSPAHRDLLQLSAGEETDPLAVGREERFAGSVRAGDRPGFLAIH